MGWFLLAVVVGLVVFAAVYDAIAKRRGAYRPPEQWHAARERRKVRGRPFRAGPKDRDSL
jgi:hypothetical protein